VKATQRDFAGQAQRAAKQCSVFYFCGPDEAGASAAAGRIASLLDDPGERVEISGADLRKDPVLLGDEARSGSLFGDARHIWVRTSGDEALDAVGNLLLGTGDACPVLIVAASATDKSRIAKLLEKRDDALVAMFYPPELRDIAQTIRSMGDGLGVHLNGDLAERIARAAGMDIRLAGSEVEKLALYLDASPERPVSATVEHLDEIGAKTEDDGFMPVVNAVLAGDVNKLQAELQRVQELSLNPVGVLLAFERRTAQLAQLSAKIGPRGDISGAIEQEKRARRIFWKDVRDIEKQIRRWRGQRLDRLVNRLVELHRALLGNNQSAELLLSQGLAEIARAAAPRK
jgi:DNA polymerase-3 subunit delta